MVKYTSPLTYIGLSESDSKLYIDIEVWEANNHKHMKIH